MPSLSIFSETQEISHSLRLSLGSRIKLWFFVFLAICHELIKTPMVTVRLMGKFKNKPFTFHIDNRFDFPVLREIFSNDEYVLPFEIHPKIIFDIGANIGTTTVFFALTYPDAVIYSIEADPCTYRKLQTNTAQFKNVQTFNFAISNTDGTLIFNKGESHLGGSLKNRKDAADRITVSAKKLSTFLKERKIDTVDLLKIDIEGAEEEVFADITNHPEIKLNTIAAELHYDLADKTILDNFKNRFNKAQVKPLKKDREIFYGTAA